MGPLIEGGRYRLKIMKSQIKGAASTLVFSSSFSYFCFGGYFFSSVLVLPFFVSN